MYGLCSHYYFNIKEKSLLNSDIPFAKMNPPESLGSLSGFLRVSRPECVLACNAWAVPVYR